MTAEHDEMEAHRRWKLKRYNRAMRNVWRTLDINTAAMAERASLRRRRRWQPVEQPNPFNPIAEFRKEVLPLVAQMVALAGEEGAASAMPAKPKRRSRKG